MCNPSPAKILRNVKRITHYLEQQCSVSKEKSKTVLSSVILPPISIQSSSSKSLTIFKHPRISILPKTRRLSHCKLRSTEIVPGAENDDSLFSSSYIDGGTFTTTFICHVCYDDFSLKSAAEVRTHVRGVHKAEMYSKLKNKPPFQPLLEDLNW